MPPLLTPHALHRLAPEEAPSKIEIHNLQTNLPLTDAWGRPATQQPALISASISLRKPFSSASDTDTVTKGTVHYGILSKAIIRACKELEGIIGSGDEEGLRVPMWGRTVVCWLHYCLTGYDVLPKIPQGPVATRALKQSKRSKKDAEPLLSSENITVLELEVKLPKASLLGTGVSVKGTFLYDGAGSGPGAYSMVMKLHELRIPAIIGVNPNERLAKQIVICGVEMEKWDRAVDTWAELEEIVAKTIEESSFQTLEALATFLTTRIITLFLIPHHSYTAPVPTSPHHHPQIRMTLCKPTAVTFADNPVVEFLTDTDPGNNELAEKCWKELGRVKKPPFPLQGRLDDWLTMQGFEDYRDEF
ncbi:uncharacterized protein LY89DRAFT_728868 [Mollisia scopiformis]|uniref:Dihydroneopterin aldolase/epimerase domain-containing protein n=1 Tax=Mollisia scopiformis TaxID=149040 RepID=A0A194XRH4_MOLSC|nr:uncharacterized protein LY89DRAFT_728868 [Mollisia scopiformis]KUJ22751.1 hypothetical protein LY89DRAFT_728868 [Mollisia scopiformis]